MQKKHSVLFLDIKAAYDNVSIPKLIQTLNDFEIPGQYINLIIDLLTEREIYIPIPKTNILIGPKTVNKGLPQGSPLTPLLFNMYTATISQMIENNSHINTVRR